ncbi:hypothetical protein C8J57DRAFT_579857 [Mycena rebaudengoi]|nr:hypothetical protein C8J57DRAFT_579857 [Mycena rebaudengoi]
MHCLANPASPLISGCIGLYIVRLSTSAMYHDTALTLLGVTGMHGLGLCRVDSPFLASLTLSSTASLLQSNRHCLALQGNQLSRCSMIDFCHASDRVVFFLLHCFLLQHPLTVHRYSQAVSGLPLCRLLFLDSF